QIFGLGDPDGLRQLDRGRVARVAAGDELVQPRTVAHRLRDRADLVETGRERDDSVARDRAVGRAQPDDAAERCGLLDRAAGVRSSASGIPTGCGSSTVVESHGSRPATSSYSRAQSRTVFAIGPIWSRLDANATIP